MNRVDLIEEALRRDAQERASMAGRILERLDEPSEGELENLCLDDARRRDAAVHDGKLLSVPVQQVTSELKSVFV
ncbi:MAG: addiction module protein [Rhodanobacter sp.]